MPKKTARPTKPSQQRTKEEQWRRRMAATSQATGPVSPASSVVVEPEIEAEEAASPSPNGSNVRRPETTARVRPTSSTSSTTRVPATGRGTAATMQRNATRTARNRLLTSTMSIEEEMHYVKADIRKLVILTAICLAIIIALAFVIPSIVT